jgi:asparagine synthase (glutamine-hydrolysing)
MADTITHRGPDDGGYWCDVERRIGLGHRRLAIVDLSPAGHQPMVSSGDRYVIAFNGEIYNHLDLRKELEQAGLEPAWRGHSDTETLLAGFEAWGVRTTLERAIGMFAFALWDRETGTLVLARDRLGEKPLYYGWQGQGQDAVFLFGSELKAVRAHPAFTHNIDRGALSLQLVHNYIPAPYSIYQGISKLQPGTFFTLSIDKRDGQLTQYWSGVAATEAGISAPFTGTPSQAVDELETLLMDAVRQQMMADVPLGAFLSGGVDSSTVVALMQSQSKQPVKTFTIGFNEAGYNEAQHAKAVAAHLGTDHTELYVTASESMDVIPKLPHLYDEPFSDSSQIPTFLVSQLAKSKVTVSLSGDAGDELFCGYNRYNMASRLWRNLELTPAPLKRLAAEALVSVSPGKWDRIGRSVGGVFRRGQAFANLGDKLHKGAGVLASKSCSDLYLDLISHWRNATSVVIGATELPTLLKGNEPELANADNIQRMMLLDMLTYLPDDILVKVDRAAMGVALETRVPFLDHRVVEFAWRLPQSYKLRDGQTKWALRQVLYKHVPKSLIERPKMGFGVPIGSWLRGPLRGWAEELLNEGRLRREGFFDPVPIRRKWDEHLSGKRNWQYHLWDILMFQSWFENTRG